MRIFTNIHYIFKNGEYVLDKAESFEYNGNIELCCGASSQTHDTYNLQNDLTKTLISQMQTEFGAASNVFGELSSVLLPIEQAGPSQQGFSQGELSTLNSAAITNVGQQYGNAKQALGEQIAAEGGGNISLPSGARIAPQIQLSNAAARETSSELNQINQANYATGRNNWLTAVQGLAGAPSVFNPSTGAAGVSVNSGADQSKTANDITQANNSWVNALIGAGGAILGGAIGNPGLIGDTGEIG